MLSHRQALLARLTRIKKEDDQTNHFTTYISKRELSNSDDP